MLVDDTSSCPSMVDECQVGLAAFQFSKHLKAILTLQIHQKIVFLDTLKVFAVTLWLKKTKKFLLNGFWNLNHFIQIAVAED